MKKTKGKVLSLILASALIVSSFSTSLVSAATSRETGSLEGVDDKIYLLSTDDESPEVDIEDLIGDVSVETYDHEDAGSGEFVSYTHASGDRLVKIDGEGNLTVKKNASGKEVITVTFEGEYTRDDKDVTVRASKDITIYADVKDEQFLGKVSYDDETDLLETQLFEKPDPYESAAVNDAALEIGVYTAQQSTEDGATDIEAEYNIVTDFDDPENVKVDKDDEDSDIFDLSKDEDGNFNGITVVDGIITVPIIYTEGEDGVTADEKSAAIAAATAALTAAQTAAQTAADDLTAAQTAAQTAADDLTDAQEALDALEETDPGYAAAQQAVADAQTAKDTADDAVTDAQTAKDTADDAVTDAQADLDAANDLEVGDGSVEEKLAKTGSETLEITLKDADGDTDEDDYKITVAKKYRVKDTAEVNKKGSATRITKGASWDEDWTSKEIEKETWSISNYDIALDAGTLTVTNGKLGDVSGKGSINVDGGTVGDIKAAGVSVDGGSVGTIKIQDDNTGITVTDGKVKAIDAKKAEIDISGGTISGNVVGKTVSIDSDDEDIPTTINGDVTAKGDTPTIEVSSGDSEVVVTGTLKGEVTLSDEATVGAIDADYDNNVTFDNFSGKLTGDTGLKNTKGVEITLDGDSEVSVKGKVVADTLTVEDGSKLTVDEATFASVEGEGTLAIPAGKLFIEDSITDTTLQLTTGLVAGATAFEAYTDTVDPDDFVTLGYTVEQKAVNDDVDKFVIKTVTFAGLSFDKAEVSVAKGYEDKITLSNYPDGTALPEGAQIEWAIDGNDDYITLTVEGNVGTIKVLDYNADYATDNKATVTATVVDEDGYAYDDYVVATTKVTGTALPASTLTLDTKSASVGVGGLYQFLAKSSSGAVITAVSSDEQIATVTPYDLLDPRGAKFSVNGVKEGKATITATDANGATASFEVTVVKVNGTLKADTTSYKFAPGNIYDVKFTVTGTNAVPVVTANGKVVSVVSRGNGVYRVTALTPGTAWVQATVGNARVSITFVVENGATAGGVRGNNVSNL